MSGGSLSLSREHGLNPHLTVCPICGRDGDCIILTGSAREYTCGDCKQVHIGMPENKRCSNCDSLKMVRGEEPDPSRKLPALCQQCEDRMMAEQAEQKRELEMGGIPFRCADCKTTGVIKHDSEFVKQIKKDAPKRGLPAAFGIEFKAVDCPVCSQKKQ